MKLTLPDCIIFDLDDTLYRTKSPHDIALKKSLVELSNILGIELPKVTNNYFKARSEIKLILGETAASHNRLLYFQRLLEMYSMVNFSSYALKIENLYWTEYLNHMRPFDGLKKLMINIKKKGILIAIVTDLNAQIQMKKIIKLEISHLIDCLVTSEEAGLDKPNFSCFSILNEKINKNNIPLKYWMVGDDIRKDLIGAKIELEARTFWIDIFEKGNKKNRYIDHQINSLLEINEFI